METASSANLKMAINQKIEEKNLLISTGLKTVFKSRLKAPVWVENLINYFMDIKSQMKEMMDLMKTAQTKIKAIFI